jgi:5-methylcytosine-specific restriction endonuclease McrA
VSYNSTIKVKTGICPLCAGTEKKPLTAGFCGVHYWQSRRMKSAQRQQEKELSQDEDLQTLVSDLDILFSRYIRLKDAIFGRVECFCCGAKDKWTMMDAAHFIPRAHMYTRFNETNVKPCCQKCNRAKDGNIKLFADHLERDQPGSVEVLQEHARIVYKYSREELKSMIAEYSIKVKRLQNNN